MTDALEESVSESTLHRAGDPVTYTLKVLSAAAGGGGEARRTVLFQRTSARESIEIRAETDARNLLAELPLLLEAALEIQRSAARLPPGSSLLLTEESRRVRWLTEGAAPAETTRRRGVFRLIGTAYRTLSREGSVTATRFGAPPRARGWAALRPRRWRRAR